MYAGHKLVAVTIYTKDGSNSTVLVGGIQLSVLQYRDMLRHGKTLKVCRLSVHLAHTIYIRDMKANYELFHLVCTHIKFSTVHHLR